MPAFISNSAKAASVSNPLPHAVWRADQMGSYQTAVISSGYRALDAELPNGGWPGSALIELLLERPGIGEMRLLRPALHSIARKRRVALLQPPHLPQVAAWTAWGLPSEQLLWLRPERSADAWWSAEQVLRNGSCGALLFWQTQARSEALRRLQLAAQSAQTAFWMLRPLADARNPSPAPLRLALRPAGGCLVIDIIKRRGPRHGNLLHLPLDDNAPSPLTSSHFPHAHLDRRIPAAAATRNNPAALV